MDAASKAKWEPTALETKEIVNGVNPTDAAR
jgi:hypothetical protein